MCRRKSLAGAPKRRKHGAGTGHDLLSQPNTLRALRVAAADGRLAGCGGARTRGLGRSGSHPRTDATPTGVTMLWKHYVYRRGESVHELWEPLFKRRPMRLLYIAGKGFDVRAQIVMRECVASIQASGQTVAA